MNCYATITVIGRDKTGVVAKVTNLLFETKANIEALRPVVWEYMIIDEAHRLKNREAKALAALRELTCVGTKLALTGTPLQNDVSELWSILNFLDGAVLLTLVLASAW